jgi:putative FmdB family regulatory protein
MPLYDYDCAACGRRFEVVHGLHAPAPEACPLCGGGPVRKAFAPPAIHFKGSGWAKKERRSTSSAAKPSSDGDGSAATKGSASDGGAGKAATSATSKASDGASSAGSSGD